MHIRWTALLALSFMTSTASAQAPQRAGLWGDLAVGWGSLGCEVCNERTGGVSGGFTIGGTLNRNLRVGLAANAWMGDISITEDGSTTSGGQLAATLMPIAQLYPVGSARLFLRGGVGFGLATEPGTLGRGNTGLGSVVGIGYDITGEPASGVTISLNRVGIHSERNRSNFFQAALAITFH